MDLIGWKQEGGYARRSLTLNCKMHITGKVSVSMPRSGRIMSGGSGILCFLLPQQLLLVLVLLLLSPGRAYGYDEALARRLIVYCSIAISEPEEVDAWTFPNPRTCCISIAMK